MVGTQSLFRGYWKLCCHEGCLKDMWGRKGFLFVKDDVACFLNVLGTLQEAL